SEVQRHIMCADIAALLDVVPGCGVPDVIDRHVVMLAPEERDGGVALATAEHVARDRLALPLGDDPVLDAQPLAAVGVGPTGMSPAAKIPGALVSRYSSTSTPRSVERPASRDRYAP